MDRPSGHETGWKTGDRRARVDTQVAGDDARTRIGYRRARQYCEILLRAQEGHRHGRGQSFFVGVRRACIVQASRQDNRCRRQRGE